MIDRQFIGLALTPFSATAEAGRLRFFAKATGQTQAVYIDEAAARAAGYAALPVPATFLFSMELEAPDPSEAQRLLGMDVRHVLHGEQHFTYHRVAYAGERLHFAPRITDIYDKRGGALEFVVRETAVTDDAGQAVADLRRVIVLRNR